MEWVETTGRTLEEAKEAALDQLGVDERDAEFEVLAEAKRGLFGIGSTDARVRARVRPAVPRAKDDRRRRRERGRGRDRDRGGDRGGRGDGGRDGAGRPRRSGEHASARADDGGRATGAGAVAVGADVGADAALDDADEPAGTVATPAVDRSPAGGGSGRPRRRRGANTGGSGGSGGSGGGASWQAAGDGIDDDDDDGGDDVEADLSVAEQADLARAFVTGLVDAFGLTGSVAVSNEEDAIDIAVTGDDLGVLIGPKGATLQAIQELARTAVQRRTPNRVARLHVDVAGYRAKRREALERFTHQVAAQVTATGTRRALEPMNAADRKIVHDTANLIDGVSTTSEGEEPRRRVVILPAADGSGTDQPA